MPTFTYAQYLIWRLCQQQQLVLTHAVDCGTDSKTFYYQQLLVKHVLSATPDTNSHNYQNVPATLVLPYHLLSTESTISPQHLSLGPPFPKQIWYQPHPFLVISPKNSDASLFSQSRLQGAQVYKCFDTALIALYKRCLFATCIHCSLLVIMQFITAVIGSHCDRHLIPLTNSSQTRSS